MAQATEQGIREPTSLAGAGSGSDESDLRETGANPPARRPASRLIRLGLCVAVLVYLVYSSFGIASPFFWGHHGYHGATYAQRARMTLRFGLVVPATAAGFDKAPPSDHYYLHHPIGYHYVLLPFFKLLGDAEWVVRSVAVLGGLVTLWALWRLLRRFYGDGAGLLGVAVYVSLPILCSFSVLSDPMLLEMACCVIAVEGFIGYQERPNRRDLLRACAGLFVGGFLMWEVNFLAFFCGLYAIGWWLRLHSHKTPINPPGSFLSPPVRWFLATFLATVIPFAFHFVFTWRIGMLSDFFSSFRERHDASFGWTVARQFKWLSLLYGPLLIAAGIAWLLRYVLRLGFKVTQRRDQAPLIFFLINTIYIALFAKGASIHLYRVFFYSTFLTIAVVDLLLDLKLWTAERLFARGRSMTAARRGGIVAMVVGALVYFALDLPLAYKNLRESREMMGTHGHIGYDPELKKTQFAIEVEKQLDRNDYVFLNNLTHRVEIAYYLDRREELLGSLSMVMSAQRAHPHSVVLLESHLPSEQTRILYRLLPVMPATLYDSYLMLDLRPQPPKAGPPAFREFHFQAQPMSESDRWFRSHKYPRLQPVPQFGTFAQCVYAYRFEPPPADAPPPAQPDVSPFAALDGLLCYHNFLVAAGKRDEATAFRGRLATLWTPPAGPEPLSWLGTGQVLGTRTLRSRGRADRLEAWILLGPDGVPPRQTRRYFKLTPLPQGTARVAQEQKQEVLRDDGPSPWMWRLQAGYLVVVTVPLPGGRHHLTLYSEDRPVGRFGPPALTELDLGEVGDR